MHSILARSTTGLVAACAAFAFTLAGRAAPARAQPPTCNYQWVDVKKPTGRAARAAAPHLVFLNRCAGGCTVYHSSEGADDSRQNVSIVPEMTSYLAAYAGDDQAWDELVACVRGLYSPFDIDFTETDPSPAPHVEAMVAGSPSDVQQASNVGGIASFNCAGVDNAMAFAFAEVYAGEPRQLCETVAHEIGHTLGLDHELFCPDPMTYLHDCGDKTFQDEDEECGEDGPRPCMCPGGTQNSYEHLASVLNEVPPTPPSLEIVEPKDGDAIEPGFPIEIAAIDDVAISSVEVYLAGVLMDQSARTPPAAGPYRFAAPTQLPTGEIELRAVAIDDRGDRTEKAITVVRNECTSSDQCSGTESCSAGACLSDASAQEGGGCATAPDAAATGLSALLLAGLGALAALRRRARPPRGSAPARAPLRSRWPARRAHGSR
jgi:MYXO-CTERM domain-containing protein